METKKIRVVASGYFDPIHVGHIEYLKLAKELGNKLIIILNNDKQSKLKKNDVFMRLEDRKVILESLKFVDEVFISVDNDKSVCKSLRVLKPDIFANGGDRHQEEVPETPVCRELNIKMIDGLGKKIRSSSELIKNEKRKEK